MNRATILLGLGAAAGVAAAAAGLISPDRPTSRPPAAETAAVVNGHAIRMVDFERMLAAVDGDKRSALTAEDRKHVLDRLVDEELLVQRALELGLAYHDSRVRRDLTAALLDSIIAEAGNVMPSDTDLEAFYREQRELFTGAQQLHVRQIWIRIKTLADADEALRKAQQATAELRQGGEFEAVRAAYGDPEVAELPDSLLPANKLADYLGPTALRAALDVEPGEITEPVRSSSGYHVLHVLERKQAEPAPFEEAREQALEAYRRMAADDSLRAYLEDLRARAEIEFPDQQP